MQLSIYNQWDIVTVRVVQVCYRA